MIQEQPFGVLEDGRPAQIFRLASAGGVEVEITNFGGAIVSLKMPDRAGTLADIVLGYDSLEGYFSDTAYLGAVTGRNTNRIAGGRFELDGKTYELGRNLAGSNLHGGTRGFGKALWNARMLDHPDAAVLELTYTSRDGEEGFPGTLQARVTYRLTYANDLIFDCEAVTDSPTICNMSQHAYFNLKGAGRGDILGHELQIDASKFTPTDAAQIPTGEIRSVVNTPFDFREPVEIGARIREDDEQLRVGQGYDHNFVLEEPPEGVDLRFAARAAEPGSGRMLEIHTNQPGLQFYSGNMLDGSVIGKDGKRYEKHAGFCLETQHFPDAPNQPTFPSTVLRPGETYRARTVFRLRVQNQQPARVEG